MDARRQGGEGKLKTIRVCIENLIRFDCLAESHNVGDDGCTRVLLSGAQPAPAAIELTLLSGHGRV